MIKKFDDFINLNEGFIKNIKKRFNPTFEESFDKAYYKVKNKVSNWDNLTRRAETYGDIDSFIEYIDGCEYVLKTVKKMEKKWEKAKDLPYRNHHPDPVEIMESLKKKFDDFAIFSIEAVGHSFPKRIKFKTAPEWFVEQLQNIIEIHNKLSEKYGTKKIEVSKFNRR